MEEKKYSKMLIPSILSISLLTIMAPTAIAPALAAIKEAFPEISATEAKLVLTLPTLVMMPMGLYSARLTSKMDKKKLLLTGMFLFLVFGVGGGFVNNFKLLLIVRLLFGVGLGIMTPLSTSLIFDFAPDTNQRSKLMGIQGASNQLGGLVFMSLSGILASISWRYSFLCYAFVIVSIVLTFLYLPSIPACPVEKDKTNGEQKKMSKKIFILAFFSMMIFACFFVVNTDLALYMKVDNLGGADDCGYALSLMRIPAIISGMLLAWFMRNLKNWTVPFAAVVMGLGYLIIAYSYTYVMLMIGCLVVGVGGGFALPSIQLYIPFIVTPRQRTLGVAIITSVAQFGQFLSPLYTNLFVSESATDPCRARFVVSAISTVIIGFLAWCFVRTLPKKPLVD
jgi:MFS family permease